MSHDLINIEAISRHRFKDLNTLALNMNLGGYSSEILYWGFIEPLYWRNYRHIHSFFEVCYTYAGRGQFRIGSDTLEVRRGDIFFARPNEPHDIVSSHDDPLGINFWAYTLIPDAESPKGNSLAIDQSQELLANFIQSDRRDASATPALKDTIVHLTTEIAQQRPGYVRIIHGLVKILLLETARLGCNQPIQLANNTPQHHDNEESAIVLQIKRYLEDNYTRPVRLTEVSAQVHLSERHVCRIFKKQTGCSIQNYLAEIRMDVAKQMLLNQASPIAQVATATGFSDARYFSTFFRRHTGETPTAFREKRGTAFLE